MSGGLFELNNKVALITGGNSGIGLGFARGIARQGGTVEIWGRNSEKNAKAKVELEALGARISARIVDVTDENAVAAGYEALLAEHGRVDFVLANSGRGSRNYGGNITTMTSEEWHDLLATNMHGAFYTLREGARAMVKRAEAGEPGGSLVFCGSLSMFHGVGGIDNYAASKGGMGAVIRTMAAELGRYRIRCNTVAPGYIMTDITGDGEQAAQIEAFFASKTPVPRAGQPEDFEGIAAYLCSDASSFHTGDTIVIDGGSLIYPPYAMG